MGIKAFETQPGNCGFVSLRGIIEKPRIMGQ